MPHQLMKSVTVVVLLFCLNLAASSALALQPVDWSDARHRAEELLRRVDLKPSGPYYAPAGTLPPFGVEGNAPLSTRFAKDDRCDAAFKNSAPWGGYAKTWFQCDMGTIGERHISRAYLVVDGFERQTPISFYEEPTLQYIPRGDGRFYVHFSSTGMEEGKEQSKSIRFNLKYEALGPDPRPFYRPTTFSPCERLAKLVKAGLTPATFRAYGGLGQEFRDSIDMGQNAKDDAAPHRFAQPTPDQHVALSLLGYGAGTLVYCNDVVMGPWRPWKPTTPKPAKDPYWVVDQRNAIPARGFLAGDIITRMCKEETQSMIAMVAEYNPAPANSKVCIQYFSNGRPDGPIVEKSVPLDPVAFYWYFSTNQGQGDGYKSFAPIVENGMMSFSKGGHRYGLTLTPMIVDNSTP